MADVSLINNSELGLRSLNDLRVNTVLRKDEHKRLDERLIRPALEPLRAFQDLLDNDLVLDLGEEAYLDTTVLEFENNTRIREASLTMDGSTETEGDRPEFNLFSVPLPLMVSEFSFSDRLVRQSRKLGTPLPTLTAEQAARRVSEKLEDIVVNGDANFVFKGSSIEGYTNAANRLTDSFSNGAWDTATPSGSDMQNDLESMISTAEAQNFFGPYMVYIPRAANTNLMSDFKTNSDKTIRERLLENDPVIDIRVLDKLASGNVLLVQMTQNVVEAVRGFDPTTIEWPSRGGLRSHWAVLAGSTIKINTDGESSKSGIVHLS